MYYLFCHHHWEPSKYYDMGEGERLIIRAFIQQEIKDGSK